MQPTYPLPDLIARRCEELGLTRMQLLRRMGYANVTKGLRRLTAIEQGDLRCADQFHGPLAMALEIPPEVVEDAFAATRAALDAAAEAGYREAFQPHGVILTERSVPSPIFVAAFMGVDRLLRIRLDTDAHPTPSANRHASACHWMVECPDSAGSSGMWSITVRTRRFNSTSRGTRSRASGGRSAWVRRRYASEGEWYLYAP